MSPPARHRSPWVPLVLFVLALAGPGCQRLLEQHRLRDSVAVTPAHTAELPRGAPRQVYVADFRLPAADFHPDLGVAGALPGQRGRARADGPRLTGTRDPDARMDEIVQTLAESLVAELRARDVPATRLPPGAPPREGWLILGRFTEVDEGNRLRRSALGFSQGASRMAVEVGIADLAAPGPVQPFVEFGTVKEPGQKPGAIVTLNPYAAAARFVMERDASARDTRRTAARIVDELLAYREAARARAAAPLDP